MKRLLLLTLLTAAFTSYAADASSSSAKPPITIDDDPSLPPEERFKHIMKSVYGALHSLHHQDASKPEDAQQFAETITRTLQFDKPDDQKQKELVGEIHTARVGDFSNQMRMLHQPMIDALESLKQALEQVSPPSQATEEQEEDEFDKDDAL